MRHNGRGKSASANQQPNSVRKTHRDGAPLGDVLTSSRSPRKQHHVLTVRPPMILRRPRRMSGQSALRRVSQTAAESGKIPDRGVLTVGSRENSTDAAIGGLSQPAVFHHRAHRMKMDPGPPQKAQQWPLHDGAPMRQPVCVADLHNAAHQTDARQQGGMARRAAQSL